MGESITTIKESKEGDYSKQQGQHHNLEQDQKDGCQLGTLKYMFDQGPQETEVYEVNRKWRRRQWTRLFL